MSPIRRYPDLAIHRIIKDYLRNGAGSLKKYEKFAADASTRSSERERYVFNADLMRLDSRNHSYRIGDPLHIVVSAVLGTRVAFKLK